ncbi:MAG: hypothetical protein MJ107_00190 [Lachnospiraceae bacterium]|nr:hypothetical protein [Lachnospiraceae bacterium]
MIISFDKVPGNVEELKQIPEASLSSEYASAALGMLVLLNYEKNPEATMEMVDFLNGPDNVSAYSKQFYKDRLLGKAYVPKSFFKGATVENNYEPQMPLTIEVTENIYSYSEENYCTLYVKSSGADSPRPIKLRKKPSTGQWFVIDNAALADIRRPAAADPWA